MSFILSIMTKGEKFYRSKYPKVKKLSGMDIEIISILDDFIKENNKIDLIEIISDYSKYLEDYKFHIRGINRRDVAEKWISKNKKIDFTNAKRHLFYNFITWYNSKPKIQKDKDSLITVTTINEYLGLQ